MRFFIRKTGSSLMLFIFFTLIIFNMVSSSPVQASSRVLSTNIPLNSYIYTYLDKLDGLGYLASMPPDTKPFTRMQVAKWVWQIAEQTAGITLPDYARTMLEQLQAEFTRELDSLKTGSKKAEIRLAEENWEYIYYDGPSLGQHQTQSTYQPLNINNNGERLEEDLNSVISLLLEGNIGANLVFSAAPRFWYDRTDDFATKLTSGYVKTHIGNLGIQLGKDAMWWGPGEWGSLPLTNNAAPQTSLLLSNLEPIQLDGILGFLKEANGTFFYSELKDDRQYIKDPSFVGFRVTFTPLANFTFGGSLNSIVGGAEHNLSGEDYLEFFTGKNAESNEEERWNSIAGFDFRWRIPQLRGIEVYGEFYGEDQAGKLPLPSRNAYLFGVKIPRLSADGKWDLTLEKAQTTNCWYQHWVYKEGYVYKGDIIGDAMGYNAWRYNLKLSRYLTDGAWLAVTAEHLMLDRDAQFPQKVNSLQLSYIMNLQPGLTFNASVGVADIDNLNYQSGQSDRNYLGSISLRKHF